MYRITLFLLVLNIIFVIYRYFKFFPVYLKILVKLHNAFYDANRIQKYHVDKSLLIKSSYKRSSSPNPSSKVAELFEKTSKAFSTVIRSFQNFPNPRFSVRKLDDGGEFFFRMDFKFILVKETRYLGSFNKSD